jgi:hypothetical protein
MLYIVSQLTPNILVPRSQIDSECFYTIIKLRAPLTTQIPLFIKEPLINQLRRYLLEHDLSYQNS